jgi:hypothetical protein
VASGQIDDFVLLLNALDASEDLARQAARLEEDEGARQRDAKSELFRTWIANVADAHTEARTWRQAAAFYGGDVPAHVPALEA